MAKLPLGCQIQHILEVNGERFCVRVVYTDGKVFDIPLAGIFAKPKHLAAEILRGNLFERCFLESGALVWPNGLELCPDAMRMWGQEVKLGKKAPRKKRA